MEVKINREIRNYTESMFFGLSLRQFIFSVLACGAAVGLYFLLRPVLGTEAVSWVCILGAAPFAALGFVRYHGMNAEQFLWAWIKSQILIPKRLVFQSENFYYEALKPSLESHKKEALKAGTESQRKEVLKPSIGNCKKEKPGVENCKKEAVKPGVENCKKEAVKPDMESCKKERWKPCAGNHRKKGERKQDD